MKQYKAPQFNAGFEQGQGDVETFGIDVATHIARTVYTDTSDFAAGYRNAVQSAN
jgi:hypothetical protein